MMRIHLSQFNQNEQLDRMYAAQRAEARLAAERTRKKLLEFASEIASEAEEEAIVVKLHSSEEQQRQQHQGRGGLQVQLKKRKSGTPQSSISDWA